MKKHAEQPDWAQLICKELEGGPRKIGELARRVAPRVGFRSMKHISSFSQMGSRAAEVFKSLVRGRTIVVVKEGNKKIVALSDTPRAPKKQAHGRIATAPDSQLVRAEEIAGKLLERIEEVNSLLKEARVVVQDLVRSVKAKQSVESELRHIREQIESGVRRFVDQAVASVEERVNRALPEGESIPTSHAVVRGRRQKHGQSPAGIPAGNGDKAGVKSPEDGGQVRDVSVSSSRDAESSTRTHEDSGHHKDERRQVVGRLRSAFGRREEI